MKSLQIPSAEISDHEQMCRDQVIAIAKLRKSELKVLYTFADGLTPQQVADRLAISIKTVDVYKTRLLAFCRNVWNLPIDAKLDYHFLHTKFARVEESNEGMQPTVQGEHSPATEMLLQAQTGGLSTQERAYCDQVIARASKRELKVLDAFADGLTPQQVADRLFISIKTVDTHKTKLLALCRCAWNLSPDEWLDYRFLNKKFAHFSSDAQRKTAGALR